MRDIEKNDVDVFELFNWKKPVKLMSVDGKKDTTIYMRVVGDSDLQRARVYGFRKSAEMRKRLRTQDSDERVAFLMELEQFADKDSLVETILLLNIQNYRDEAIKNVNVPLPKEPNSDDGVEEQERYQAEVDEYPAKFSKAVGEYMTKKTKDERKRLSEVSFDKLYKEYEKLLIDRLVSDELTRSYYSKLVFFACYLDETCKVRLFNDYEEFDNYPSPIKDMLISEYQMLDMSLDALKK